MRPPHNPSSSPSGPPTSGHPPTAKIATKSGHKQRTSLLGGATSNPSYQPLRDHASSFGSARAFAPSHEPYVPGGYHDRQGLGPNVKGGKNSKMFLPNTLWTWSFFGIALLQAIISLGLEAYVFGEFEASLLGPPWKATVGSPAPTNGDPPAGVLTIPTYLAIFIFGFLYQLVLVWDALRLKNTIQVIGICIYNLGMMIYAAVEMDQVKEAVEDLGGGNIDISTWTYLNPCLIAAPCVIALGTILLSFIAWKIYAEFAWTIYKHISADLKLKQRYLVYQVSNHPPFKPTMN